MCREAEAACADEYATIQLYRKALIHIISQCFGEVHTKLLKTAWGNGDYPSALFIQLPTHIVSRPVSKAFGRSICSMGTRLSEMAGTSARVVAKLISYAISTVVVSTAATSLAVTIFPGSVAALPVAVGITFLLTQFFAQIARNNATAWHSQHFFEDPTMDHLAMAFFTALFAMFCFFAPVQATAVGNATYLVIIQGTDYTMRMLGPHWEKLLGGILSVSSDSVALAKLLTEICTNSTRGIHRRFGVALAVVAKMLVSPTAQGDNWCPISLYNDTYSPRDLQYLIGAPDEGTGPPRNLRDRLDETEEETMHMHRAARSRATPSQIPREEPTYEPHAHTEGIKPISLYNDTRPASRDSLETTDNDTYPPRGLRYLIGAPDEGTCPPRDCPPRDRKHWLEASDEETMCLRRTARPRAENLSQIPREEPTYEPHAHTEGIKPISLYNDTRPASRDSLETTDEGTRRPPRVCPLRDWREWPEESEEETKHARATPAVISSQITREEPTYEQRIQNALKSADLNRVVQCADTLVKDLTLDQKSVTIFADLTRTEENECRTALQKFQNSTGIIVQLDTTVKEPSFENFAALSAYGPASRAAHLVSMREAVLDAHHRKTTFSRLSWTWIPILSPAQWVIDPSIEFVKSDVIDSLARMEKIDPTNDLVSLFPLSSPTYQNLLSIGMYHAREAEGTEDRTCLMSGGANRCHGLAVENDITGLGLTLKKMKPKEPALPYVRSMIFARVAQQRYNLTSKRIQLEAAQCITSLLQNGATVEQVKTGMPFLLQISSTSEHDVPQTAKLILKEAQEITFIKSTGLPSYELQQAQRRSNDIYLTTKLLLQPYLPPPHTKAQKSITTAVAGLFAVSAVHSRLYHV